MTTLTHTSILSTALAYLRAELCVLPALAETKQPRFAWREFQKRKPTPENLLTWFSDSSEVTLCILTGAVSGNLEMLDFDAGGEFRDDSVGDGGSTALDEQVAHAKDYGEEGG